MKKTMSFVLFFALWMFSLFAKVKKDQSTVIQRSFLISDSLLVSTDEFHVSGMIKESKKGVCGKKCIGGYVRILLARKLEGCKYKNIYVVTGCKRFIEGTKVSFIVKPLYGTEPECVYRNHFYPKTKTKRSFYRIINASYSYDSIHNMSLLQLGQD